MVLNRQDACSTFLTLITYLFGNLPFAELANPPRDALHASKIEPST